MENNDFSPEKSLQVISEAIARSRRDFEKDAGAPMIVWGVVVLLFSIVISILLFYTSNPYWNFLWFGIPVVGWPVSSLCLKRLCRKPARNFINETIGQIWKGYGIFATVIAVALVFWAHEVIGLMMIVLLGFAAYMTGEVLRNRFISVGGFLTGVGGAAILLIVRNPSSVGLVFAVASVLTLILPGIMTNRKK